METRIIKVIRCGTDRAVPVVQVHGEGEEGSCWWSDAVFEAQPRDAMTEAEASDLFVEVLQALPRASRGSTMSLAHAPDPWGAPIFALTPIGGRIVGWTTFRRPTEDEYTGEEV